VRLSKRTFLATFGGAALMRPGRARAQDFWDVIVVGGGTAGLPTAIFAAQRGARVLLIEKSGQLGGTLDRSAGQIAAAGTRFQAAKSIADTSDAHYDDILRITRGTCDPALARLFVDHAAATVDWLADNGFTTLPEHPLLEGAHEAFTTARYLWGAEGGRSILKVLKPLADAAASQGKITVLMRTGAVELMQDNKGAVTGVVTEAENGDRAEHRGKNVVLASGGCAANPAMFQDLHGVPLYARAAYPFSQGNGIELGVAAGGYVRGGEKYLCNSGSILVDANYPSPIFASAVTDPRIRKPWEIIINKRGERFLAEDNPSVDAREHALLKQPGMRSWIILDQEMLDTAPALLPSLPKDRLAGLWDLHPMFASATTVEELARKVDVPANGLTQTINGYNAGRSRNGDVFGRKHMPLPVARGPFYAVAQQGISILSFAGLAVNDQLRVVGEDGEAVANLFAVGEVIGAGATSGNAYTNGMMVTPALTFGRLLGQELLTW
jgi:fumarate reductase flavoprotein subunit